MWRGGVLLAAALLHGAVRAQTARKYEGVKVDFVGASWTQTAYQKHALAFEQQTGCKINFIANDAVTLVPLMRQHNKEGFGSDVYMILSLDLAQAAGGGYASDITEKVRSSSNLVWDDFLPFYREFGASFDRHTYGIPADGGLMGMFGRSDLVPPGQEPRTIDELVEMVERFDGQDLNGDGVPDHGWCECAGGTDELLVSLVRGEFVQQFVVTYMQSKGTQQGFLFDPVTMEPRLDAEGFREGFAKAVQVWQKGTRLPQSECWAAEAKEMSIETFNIPKVRWSKGECAFGMWWAGGVLNDVYFANNSFINGKVRLLSFPGTTHVDVDGKLTDCSTSPAACPYAKDEPDGRRISSTPFAGLGGGYTFIIGNHSRNVDAAFDFLTYLVEPERSTQYVVDDPSYEPFRFRHLTPDRWVEKWGQSITNEFLDVITEGSVGDNNIAPDVMLPEAVMYSVDLAAAFDTAVSGEKTNAEAIEMLRGLWKSRFEKNGGVEVQRDLYRRSIGLGPYNPPLLAQVVASGLESWHYGVIAGGCGLAVLVILLLVYKYRKSQDAFHQQFNNNVVAERCAEAIASLDLKEVEYLKQLEKPNTIQAAFITIIDRLNEYKAYMPQSLFRNQTDEEDTDASQVRTKSDSRSQSHSKSSRDSAVSGGAGGVIAQRKKVNLSTELSRRTVSVIVANVRGITVTARKSSPSEVSSYHQKYLERMLQAVNSNRGIIDEVMGDKVHASFNTAYASGMHRRSALTCLCQMTIGQDESSRFQVNAAATTSSALCGNIGCRDLMRYGIIGKGAAFVWVLERWACGWGLPNLVDESLATGSTNFLLRHVVCAQVTQSQTITVLEVLEDLEGQDNEEWMYQLEKCEGRTQLYAAFNKAVAALYSGDLELARKTLEVSDTPHDARLHQRINVHAMSGPAKPIPAVSVPDLEYIHREGDYRLLVDI